MNERAYISKGVTTRSNFFDETVQQAWGVEEQLTQGSTTTGNRALGSHEGAVFRDAATQCDIVRT
jgi:hypothetical protein